MTTREMIATGLALLLAVAPLPLDAQHGPTRNVWARTESKLAHAHELPAAVAHSWRRGALRGARIGALAAGLTAAGVAAYYLHDQDAAGLYVLAFGVQGALLGSVVGGIIGAIVGASERSTRLDSSTRS